MKPDEFWAHIKDMPNGCRFWVGSVDHNGRGSVRTNRRQFLVHRYAWQLVHGKIPDGLLVCHKCDINYPLGDITYRRCCNPDHLWLGTNAENSADMVAKGRQARGERHNSVTSPETLMRGEQVNTARLTAEDVRVIRRRLADGETQRGLAREYGVWQASIYAIAHSMSWQHVPIETDRVAAYLEARKLNRRSYKGARIERMEATA